MCCTTEAKMKSTGTLIFLGLLGICLGIGGGAHGSETEVEADVLGSESVQVLFVGFPLKLSCNMTYNESIYTKVKWFKDNEELESNDHIKLFVVNSSLVIMKPGKEDAGDYRCETLIEVSEDKPHVKSFKVIYFEIRKMDKSTNIDKGEDLVLECPVEGSPYPTIQWKKDDVPIYDAINGTRLTPKANEKNVPNATLIISKAEWIDRGNFTCTITTLSNTFERFTYVRVKDVYAALWPFLGIVIEVLLLGIIIFIFEKRRAKAEFEESDTDQGNDQKNTADHNKDSVRQRK